MVVKRCTKPYSVFRNGRPQVVTPGMLLDEDDPRYRERAGRFEDVSAYVDRTGQVETTTAEPGEQRQVTPAQQEPAVTEDEPEVQEDTQEQASASGDAEPEKKAAAEPGTSTARRRPRGGKK